jgi:branched-chain amino acid transport system ATP-binding protein
VLLERKDKMGTALSGGQQQMLAVGPRCSAIPRVLLLDEPSEGFRHCSWTNSR